MFSRLAMRLRRRRSDRRCSGRSVSIKRHRLLRGWARRGGWRGGVGRSRAPLAVAAVEPLQASSVCGVMARQGRCVAEAGVRDAASCGRMQHAEAWVCPPASFPWPPFGSASLSPAPLPLPGVRSSARRLREARRAGRPREGVDVGCGAPGGVSVRRSGEGVPVVAIGLRHAQTDHRRRCSRRAGRLRLGELLDGEGHDRRGARGG